MSIYIIVPEPLVSTSIVKVGMTAKNSNSKKPVHLYLYERYRTTYGKKLTAYIWECKTYKEMEKQIFTRFAKYKVDGSEIFKGSWKTNIFKKVFQYCCENISQAYSIYTEGDLTVITPSGWRCVLM